MRVLITNMRLTKFSGTEVVAELTADGLRRAGHEPVVYAPLVGDQAERMKVRGHRTIDRLKAMPFRPDVIHAQHCTPALMAMTAFPDVPVVYVCHSPRFHLETPLIHPQVRRFVAVDQLCHERCLASGVPKDRLSTVYNAVDLMKFVPREPLPPKPKRALLLTKTRDQRAAVLEACGQRDIEVVELGSAIGRISPQIEAELPAFDIVFATARMAIEAAAVGCAVVVGDGRGLAGLLTTDRWPEWRKHNLGAALLSQPVTAERLGSAIDDYDPNDARTVSDAVRRTASSESYIEQMVSLYRQAMDEGVRDASEASALAVATLLEDWLPSPADRPWREMAGEMKWLPSRASELQDLETRLEAVTTFEGRKTRRMLDKTLRDSKR